MDLHVPAVELNLPSEDRRAYWTLGPDHNGVAAFHTSEKRSGWVLPVLRGRGVQAWDGGGFPCHGRNRWLPALLTQNRRRNHRFRRPSLTKPRRKFTCVHPSDLPLARFARMVRVCLGLHPSALACFVTWHLQGSGTYLDTGWSMTTSHAHSSWCYIASRAPSRTGRARLRASGSPVSGSPDEGFFAHPGDLHPCRTFHLSPFVMSWALPQALGYYGDSVALGITAGRRSRGCLSGPVHV